MHTRSFRNRDNAKNDDRNVVALRQQQQQQQQLHRQQSSLTRREEGTPLSVVANAFEELARSIESGSRDLQLAQFSAACSLVSVLFGCLGMAFKFAEIEYVAKVQDLLEASKTYDTLENVLDHDLKNGSVRKPGSHSRNLRRVRQGLDLIKALFEQFLSSNGCSLKEAASTAYSQMIQYRRKWKGTLLPVIQLYGTSTTFTHQSISPWTGDSFNHFPIRINIQLRVQQMQTSLGVSSVVYLRRKQSKKKSPIIYSEGPLKYAEFC
ncbi:Glycolipid transfer protein domain-containing protein [Cinnamomum micranthum f. kanehirae]|uniref:Glycolipid transfer protein domain-containing protein n=1 Tax=Cinnamomum micranthum f. kanehirae TaxID=337451 RepID=A0A443NM49_9MAGN|nr:Glycolipid transfer protein domain-containing protein [Cinnamomum micranthum f. kanehirae]